MIQCSACLTWCPKNAIVRLDCGGSVETVCHDCYPEVAKVFDAPKVVREEEHEGALPDLHEER